MMDLIERRNLASQAVTIDWNNILDVMNNELPKIPAPPENEEINPPDQEMVRVVIGKLKPIDKNAKDPKKKGQKKAQPKKGDEKPKTYKWADGPPRYIKTTYHHINEANQAISENMFPMNARGDQGNPGVTPCVIKEVYFPPESPSEVATLIESALVYQSDSNFEMSIDCFEQARETWLRILKQ